MKYNSRNAVDNATPYGIKDQGCIDYRTAKE